MEYLNEADTQEKILKPLLSKVIKQNCLNETTLKLFESLSYFEKREMVKWLQTNLASIPMLSKTKRFALEKIRREQYEDPTTLALIRQTMKILYPHKQAQEKSVGG